MNVLDLLFSSGGIGTLCSFLIVVVGGFYVHRSAKTQAEKTLADSYKGAIEATKEHVNALQERMKDLETENKHLRETMDTILEILKARNIHIAIHGHMITIRDGKDTTVMRIQNTEKEET
jgi:regulator of replication initiation timing